jgi:tetratricopeptide (TPR) repeat protein
VTSNPIAEQSALALQLAREDPRRAQSVATEAHDRAVEAGNTRAESTALRALGLAARALHQIPEAVSYLRAAVEAAERASDVNLAAEARLSLAAALVLAGDSEEAMRALSLARATGETALVVASQRAAILAALGRYEEARQAYGPVISGFRRLGDRTREARAVGNRGLLYVYMGRFSQAEGDLARAQRIMGEVGNLTEAAAICQNRGFAAARKGDLPAALALLEEADRRCLEVGVQPTSRALSRAGALAAAGLFRDARRVATDTVGQFRAGGDQSYLAEGLVLLADIALFDDDPKESRAAAEEAVRLFDLQDKPGWASLAQAAVARAGLAQGDGSSSLAELATHAARHLDDMGLVDQGTMAHAVAGRLWLAAGAVESGLAELDRAGARRNRGSAPGRVVAWEALGVARLERRDRRGAMAAMSRALAVVHDQQASLGATELRAHVAVHAGAAARLGLRLALETNRARCIWQWMERHRANSVLPLPARPPRDDVLASCLAELRALAQEISSCATRGDDPGALLARQDELERRARERAWKTVGVKSHRAPSRVAQPADLSAALSAALGEPALVELGEVDGEVHAVVVAGDRWHHRRLVGAGDARRELGHIRLALRQLAFSGAHPALGVGAGEQLARATAALDGLLFGPIAALLGSRPVVVVPTGELHAVPWAALPTLAGRAVSVAPSAQMWLETTALSGTRRRTKKEGNAVVVAGPGLPGAEHEAATIGSLYPAARVLSGAQAQVVEVTDALEGAFLAHIAAHAHFRADNGLWSSLELADGVLTVYELEQLRHPPRVVVLSACQSGLSAVHPGDEMMGLVAALLTLGTRAVVASVVPVEDQASEALMVALHQRLRAGDGPAVALAAAQAAVAGSVGLSYVCFGGM